MKVSTRADAANWAALLAAFHQQYSQYLKERTYAKDDPGTAAAKDKKITGWWYTHERDRSVYQRLSRLYKNEELFAFLSTTHKLERTTNCVESINHQVKLVIKHDPGLSEDHLTCAIEWLLHNYTENPATPKQLLSNWRQAGKPVRRLIPKKRQHNLEPGPREYDTGINTNEDLWIRKGWAGRSH